MNTENKTNTKCFYYNYGGDGTDERPYYPMSYGARCELYNEFFTKSNEKLTPNCHDCASDIEKLMEVFL